MEEMSAGHDPFVELTDEAAHRAAVRARNDQRAARLRAAQTATWAGTVRDLAECRAPVTVALAGGRLAGTMLAVGADHLVLVTRTGERAWIRLDAVRTLAPDPGSGARPAGGHRSSTSTVELVDLLDHAGEERTSVRLFVQDVSEAVRGSVEAVGEDLVTLRLDAVGHPPLYVPLPAIEAVVRR